MLRRELPRLRHLRPTSKNLAISRNLHILTITQHAKKSDVAFNPKILEYDTATQSPPENSQELLKIADFSGATILDVDEKQLEVETCQQYEQPGDWDSMPDNFEDLSRFLATLPDPLGMMNVPTRDDLTLAEYANFSAALQMLIDLGVKLPNVETDVEVYKFNFLYHLTAEDVAHRIKFLTFECELPFEIMPKIFTVAPELLDPKLDLTQAKTVCKYLKDVGFDNSKLMNTIAVRALVEHTDISELDLLFYKLQKMRVMEMNATDPRDFTLNMKAHVMRGIVNAVPELLVPSLLTYQDVDRTISLCARHLTNDLSALYVLFKRLPRQLFYDRIYKHPSDDPRTRSEALKRVQNLVSDGVKENVSDETKPSLLGNVQANWKLLAYDMQMSPEEIVFKHIHLLDMIPRQLQVRAHFLRSKDLKQALQSPEIMTAHGPDFVSLLAIDPDEYTRFSKKFFL